VARDGGAPGDGMSLDYVRQSNKVISRGGHSHPELAADDPNGRVQPPAGSDPVGAPSGPAG